MPKFKSHCTVQKAEQDTKRYHQDPEWPLPTNADRYRQMEWKPGRSWEVLASLGKWNSAGHAPFDVRREGCLHDWQDLFPHLKKHSKSFERLKTRQSTAVLQLGWSVVLDSVKSRLYCSWQPGASRDSTKPKALQPLLFSSGLKPQQCSIDVGHCIKIWDSCQCMSAVYSISWRIDLKQDQKG